MAKKRLSLQDIELMKAMVVKGVAPEDIANHFNIAISSVHNYKSRFKQQGVNFPDVRGKRPTGSVEVSSNQDIKTTAASSPVSAQSSNLPVESTMNFIVNGVAVHVSKGAKNVNINKDSIEINF